MMDRSDENPLSAMCPVCRVSWPGIMSKSDEGKERWTIDGECPQCGQPALVKAEGCERDMDLRVLRRPS